MSAADTITTVNLRAYTLDAGNIGDTIRAQIPAGVRNIAPIDIDGVITAVRKGPGNSTKVTTTTGVFYLPARLQVRVPASTGNTAKAQKAHADAAKRAESQQRVRAMQNLVRAPHRIPARNPLAPGSIVDGVAGELNDAIDERFLGHDIVLPGRTGSIRGRYRGHKHIHGMVEIAVNDAKYVVDRDAEFTLTVVPRVPQNPWLP